MRIVAIATHANLDTISKTATAVPISIRPSAVIPYADCLDGTLPADAT